MRRLATFLFLVALLPAIALATDDAGAKVDILIVNLNRSAKDVSGAKRIARTLRELKPGAAVRVLHYREFNADRLAELAPKGVILSPQKDPWWFYPESDLKQLGAAVRGLKVPVLGICGGHQFLVMAFGGDVAPIRGEKTSKGYAGLEREKGIVSVEVVADSPLLGGRKPGDRLSVPVNHVEEVKSLPEEFEEVARGSFSRYQFVQHRTLPFFGVQFHPERYTRKHPSGKALLTAFLAGVFDGEVPAIGETGCPSIELGEELEACRAERTSTWGGHRE